jgi:hypothetical protein
MTEEGDVQLVKNKWEISVEDDPTIELDCLRFVTFDSILFHKPYSKLVTRVFGGYSSYEII